MKKSENYKVVEVAGDYMAVPVGSEAKAFHGVIALSEPAAFLLKKMNDQTTKDDLKMFLIEEYNVEETVAVEDIERFIEELFQLKIIEE